jgi:hypothetical protein
MKELEQLICMKSGRIQALTAILIDKVQLRTLTITT